MKKVLFALSDTSIVARLESDYPLDTLGTLTSYDMVADFVAQTEPDALVISDSIKRSRTTADLGEIVEGAHNVSPEMQIVVLSARENFERLKLELAHIREVQVWRHDEVSADNIDTLARALELQFGGSHKPYETTNWSPKGGVGKTSLNICLAQAIARVRPGTKVLLWDMDVYDADVAYGCGIDVESDHDLGSLIAEGDFSPERIESAIYHHQGSGIDVLVATQSPIDADRWKMTEAVFNAIRASVLKLRKYEVIIYDLPGGLFLFDAGFRAITECDNVFLVLTPDAFAIAAVKRILRLLENEQILGKSYFVINKARNTKRYNEIYDQAYLRTEFGGREAIARIAPSSELAESQEGDANSNETLWQLNAKSPAAADLERYALAVLSLANRAPKLLEEEREKRGLFGRKKKER